MISNDAVRNRCQGLYRSSEPQEREASRVPMNWSLLPASESKSKQIGEHTFSHLTRARMQDLRSSSLPFFLLPASHLARPVRGLRVCPADCRAHRRMR